MKRLYLVRHAKSSWNHPELTDFERSLNKRGQRDAPEMGERLASKEVSLDLMVSSTATRAITTAGIIAQKIGYPVARIVEEEAIYAAQWAGLMAVVQDLPDKSDTVMLVGHNPGFTELAEYLTDAQIDNMPTCAVICAEFDLRSWRDVSKGGGEMVFFDYPKNSQD